MNCVKTARKLQSGEKCVIAALGDSLTRGWMVRRGYLDHLGDMIAARYPDANVKILNRGVPGDTAEGGLDRLRYDVLDHDPDAVFVQFALNDLFLGVNPERFRNTMQAIVGDIRDGSGAEILLVTSVPIAEKRLNEMANVFYGIIEDIGREQGIPVARVHLHWAEAISRGTSRHGLVQADGVHPTSEGYRLMAEAVMTALQD